ncbi:MAG: NTP transferase domain-containing protein [Alphaproteobacteria bacterium]|nr:NTP transferase domain-containing protein [Alphaproteobacteria bacterium]MBV9372940.1 NTP transferase domain-containing protein [Alphaproteobacteria bacterium]MBV9900941.1 NTP transferase domain-containing protein [Alphaproteobacteria bacterium]
MAELRALVAAAGSGTRAGLPYPKTLHPVLGRPILLRLLDLLRPLDPRPAVIVSPSGRQEVERCLAEAGAAAELIEQPAPTGMGDAILRFRDAQGAAETEHLLVVWGDIPLLEPATIEGLRAAHFAGGNDFSFATRRVEEAYTIVERDASGRVAALIETREAGLRPGPGERDIGLFLFRARPVFDLLARRLEGAEGRSTGEHGFLYIVRHLAARGFKVEAVPIATERDLISLNRLSDLGDLAG